ncbi:hypothetical protein B0H10DRAFT_1960852 [Mycena sp. CBHHK59/15]|nr:hypothetical protein B0H10DRAFT_1960852 [Mycena sp. CBHHK59/15]
MPAHTCILNTQPALIEAQDIQGRHLDLTTVNEEDFSATRCHQHWHEGVIDMATGEQHDAVGPSLLVKSHNLGSRQELPTFRPGHVDNIDNETWVEEEEDVGGFYDTYRLVEILRLQRCFCWTPNEAYNCDGDHIQSFQRQVAMGMTGIVAGHSGSESIPNDAWGNPRDRMSRLTSGAGGWGGKGGLTDIMGLKPNRAAQCSITVYSVRANKTRELPYLAHVTRAKSQRLFWTLPTTLSSQSLLGEQQVSLDSCPEK